MIGDFDDGATAKHGPIAILGDQAIDVRELVFVGAAAVPTEDCVSFTVLFKSGTQCALLIEIPRSKLPRRPAASDFSMSMFASKSDMSAAIADAKQDYRERLKAIAKEQRAELIAIWREYAL